MRFIIAYPCLILTLLLVSCEAEKEDSLTAFDIYCEMVANQAKPLALHHPMDPDAVDESWLEFKQIAENRNVQIYREDSFPKSMLFPMKVTEGKTVIIIYTEQRLKQYLQLKEDILKSNSEDMVEQMALARRLGRLLGYNSQGINRLLSENSHFQNLKMFGVNHQITHLYYKDLDEALTFYNSILGLPQTDSTTFMIGNDAFISLHSINDDHPANEPKSTAIALLTDQLPQWYAYVKEKEIPIKYTYKPRNGGPHDGFVAIDPGDYLLEFEQFKQHPENELFIAVLADAPKVATKIDDLSFYGSITWTYHKDMLKMQQFYEEVLGYQLVADQGWTKIYQTSPSGFIGLVDECRGMENYADTKAVELEWALQDWGSFAAYAKQHWSTHAYDSGHFKGPEKYRYRVTK
ncbi:glyoxalase [Fulvivirga sp. RKSG066]|uniref:VOC family protein n=1 Tax=Fulvivirga aurantia TaxID=2529383 RepID=UPI0012BD5BF4|nr:VOC family protein [Fulvivirga aurantia]MTI23273.1 glyoxalase [Fulvivirga aurantia]